MAKMSSSEAKMLMLQHQMRENNMDLDAFVKDMNQWEDDIKEREQKIISKKSVNDQVCQIKPFLYIILRLKNEDIIISTLLLKIYL